MRNLTTFILFLLAFTANARQISPDEAAAIASDFLNSSSLQIANARRIGVKRARAKLDTDGKFTSPYYVFNGEGNQGFVIISGDDRAKKILGYSDAGNFDFDNLPPQLAAMLDQYTEQIASLPESAAADPSWSAPPRDASIEEGKLLETANWGQGYPYNAQCPVIDGVQCPTGCVATAMAIVMKYHNWPEEGRGFYDPHVDEYIYVDDIPIWEDCTPLLPYDFNGFRFKWDSMDNNSVAKTMLAIGRVLATRYKKEESGARIYPIAAKLHHFFRYSSNCQLLMRSKWAANEWFSMIKSQLDRGYPIIYFTEGCHAFVCDGYTGKNYFHLNFGWDGFNNGYYLLDENLPTITNPNQDTGMIINIIPSEDDKDVPLFTDPGYIQEPSLVGYQPGQLYIIRNEVDLSKCYSSEFHLYSPEKFKGEIALVSCDKDGNIKDILSSLPIDTEIEPLYRERFQFKEFSISNVAKEDNFMLVYRNSGNWHRIPGTLEASTLIPNDGYMPFVNLKWNVDPRINLSISNYELPPYINTDLSNGFPEKMIKGTRLYFLAKIPHGKQAYVHISSQDDIENDPTSGFHCGRLHDNPEIMAFNLNCSVDRAVTIKIISEREDSLIVNNDSDDDTYFDNWPIEDFERIKYAKFNGHIGYYEHAFLTNWAFGLKTLDYSEANYTSETFPEYGSVEYLQYLTEIQYPKNTKRILGAYTYQMSQLTTFVLPEGVQEIDGPFLYGRKPRIMVCKAINPPQPIGDIFDWWGGNSAATSTLIVPKGAGHLYKNADQWCLFGTIIEYEGDWRNYVPILAESLTLSPESWSGTEGDTFQITATLMPDNATNKTIEWTTSDAAVATVDSAGVVSVLKAGSCVITASTVDGSNLTAKCIITGTSGIDSMFADCVKVDVYNANGVLLKRGCGKTELKSLAPGVYIVRDKNKAKTIIIY